MTLGNIESAYCFIDSETYKPLYFAKIENEKLLELIMNSEFDDIVIEMIASYGMPVGESVFQTCVWIGKFAQASNMYEKYIYRKDEKINICHSMKAKDSNIRQALIDRFGDVGTKKNPRLVLWF